jgi:hypothetical protein
MPKKKDDFLEAVARRDLDLSLSASEVADLRRAMSQLASTARLVHAAADRPHDSSMDESIGRELLAAAESRAFDVFERTGVAEILDDNGRLVLQEMEVSTVPPEDEAFLAQCGIKAPKAEIVISVTRLKAGYWLMGESQGGQRRLETRQIIEYSRTEVVRTSSALLQREEETEEAPRVPTTNEPKKRKKYFNGIGKILSGVVAGTGNVLIGTGAIAATGGAAVAGVIASAAVSVGVIMQGIGDLRGE